MLDLDWGGYRKKLLAYNNDLFDYYVSGQFEIIKLDDYEVHNMLAFKKITNEVKKRINAKYLQEEE